MTSTELSKSFTEQIMSSSIHFAGDFLKSSLSQSEEDDLMLNQKSGDTSLDGLQVLSKLIERVMTTVGFKAQNTVIRLHEAEKSCSGLTLELSLPYISFEDGPPDACITPETGGNATNDLERDYYSKVLRIQNASIQLVEKQEDEDIPPLVTPLILLLEDEEITIHMLALKESSQYTAGSRGIFDWEMNISVNTFHAFISLEQITALKTFFAFWKPNSTDDTSNTDEDETEMFFDANTDVGMVKNMKFGLNVGLINIYITHWSIDTPENRYLQLQKILRKCECNFDMESDVNREENVTFMFLKLAVSNLEVLLESDTRQTQLYTGFNSIKLSYFDSEVIQEQQLVNVAFYEDIIPQEIYTKQDFSTFKKKYAGDGPRDMHITVSLSNGLINADIPSLDVYFHISTIDKLETFLSKWAALSEPSPRYTELVTFLSSIRLIFV
jgi:hypothetical protein